MSGLNDLGTAPLGNDLDMNNLPAEGGSFQPLIQPQPLLLEFSPLSLSNFEPIKATIDGKPDQPRVRVKFDQSAPLVIRQSVGGAHDGEPLQTGLSNAERRRGKRPREGAKDERPLVSDWDYLNSGLGVKEKPKTNVAYAEGLIKVSAERQQFRADWEWSWSCNDQKDAYFPIPEDQGGGLGPVPDPNNQGQNIKGCGKRYYQGDVQKVNVAGDGEPPVMQFPERITCACGANVRAFGNLRGFRSK